MVRQFLRTLSSLTRTHSSRLFSLTSPTNPQPPPAPPSSALVNEISRILSDHRAPHHDIDIPLAPFSSTISVELIEQVLKRTRNLGFSAHRFFLWAKQFSGFKPCLKTYKIVIDILGSTQQFPLIWDLVSEMKYNEKFELSPEIFWVIFGSYCRAKLPNDAIRAFNRMGDFGLRPSLNDLDHLLYCLCKRKLVREAQGFFDKVKLEFDPSVKSYSILVKGWGDIGDLGNARRVFDEMLQRGGVVDVLAYNSLLEALCNGGFLDEAYQIFREMGLKGFEPGASTYAIFIRAYCKGNDIHSAFKVLDRMRRYNLLPNVYTYNFIVKKLCANEKIDEAYHLLDEMISKGVKPDTWSFNTILAFHCDHCEVNRALRLISLMVNENCLPDRHTYNMVLKMLIRVGRFDKVEQVWDAMIERGFYPPVSTYAIMIHGFLKKKGKLEEVCKYFEIMIDEGIPPYPSTCEMLRKRLVGLGFLEQIDILVDKMERSSSCAIQELSKVMAGNRTGSRARPRREESSDLSEDDEWPFR